MRIAIPLFHFRVSPHFAYAQEVLLAVKGEERDWAKEKISCGHMPPLQKVSLLTHLGVNVLICGGINGELLHYLECQGIQVIAGVMGEAEQALRLYADGRLTPGAVVPGHCHRRRCRLDLPGDETDSKKVSESRSLEGEKVFHTAAKLGDLVVEIANITVAPIFLYRRVKNFLRPEKGERGSEG